MEAILKSEKKLKTNAALLTAVAGSALLLVGAGCAAPSGDDGAVNQKAPAPATKGATYKDGTYSAVGKYSSPAGPETLGVTVTLKGNIVTDAKVDMQAVNSKSVYMQDAFIAGYKAQVIGKNIDEINLGNISGSSLTPYGFNDAIAQVKTQASK